MAQKILIRRGGIDNLGSTIGVSKGELIYASGSVSGVENVVFIANADGNNTFTPVNKIYTGTAAANSFNSSLNGVPYYKTDSEALFILNSAGSTALDLSGNLEGTTVADLTVTNLTTSNINLSGDITGSNLLLTGDANINGDIVLGGSITIGNQTTDNIQVGGEFTSDLIPDADSTYNLGSNTKRWLNIYVDNVSGSTADFASTVNIGGATTLGSTLEVTTGISSSGYLYAGGALDVAGNATIDGTATITGVVTATNGISSSAYLYAAGNLDIDGTSTLTGDTSIGGALTVTTGVSSSGYVYAGTNLDVDGNATVGGTLGVTGAANFSSTVTATTGISSSGWLYAGGNLDVDGNAVVTGTLEAGATTLDSLEVTNNVNVTGTITGSDVKIDDWGSISASLSAIESGANSLSLQDVTNVGSTTTNSITVAGLTADNIQIGVTGTNEIDTVSGNLTIDSAGGTVTVDDNLVVTGDLIVQGTSTTVNSTVVEIGDNIIELNAAGIVADGGIIVKDVIGAQQLSGSLLWNATNDYWYAGVSGSTQYRLAQFSAGTGVTDNYLPKSANDGSKHLTTSIISDDGTTATIHGNISGSLLQVDTGIEATGLTGVIDTSSRVIFRDGSNRLGALGTSDSAVQVSTVLGYKADGTLIATSIIDGGTF